jgi:hypothetical protein
MPHHGESIEQPTFEKRNEEEYSLRLRCTRPGDGRMKSRLPNIGSLFDGSGTLSYECFTIAARILARKLGRLR